MSKLRINTGEFGGRLIAGPGRIPGTRPMLERVRESLFDIIARQLKNVRVLDLCAGTGSIGLEAVSRGARHVTFMEKEARIVAILRQNIAALDVSGRTTVIQGELPYSVGLVKGPFEFVFFDPPFESDLVDKVLPLLSDSRMLAKNGYLIVQRDRRSEEIHTSVYSVFRRHRIGDSELWFFEERPKRRGRPKGREEE